jgi:hypothetical protein
LSCNTTVPDSPETEPPTENALGALGALDVLDVLDALGVLGVLDALGVPAASLLATVAPLRRAGAASTVKTTGVLTPTLPTTSDCSASAV